MYNIFFNIPEARNFLLQFGMVYTLRRKRQEDYGRVQIVQGSYFHYKILGIGVISLIKKIENKNELEKYLKYSGFSTVDEWYNKKSPNANYLYIVKLIWKKSLYCINNK
jgi:hypothetical protein